MVFIYRNWERFCRSLSEKGIFSIPAAEVSGKNDSFLVLKHDIEKNVPKAFRLAEIEYQYGHRGSYYAHAYLLDAPENIRLLRQMKEMGHEISYHHDVMDSNHGNLDRAMEEFENNRERFNSLGFSIETVCQHGNPIVERVGYTSNRDFFRSERVQQRWPEITDIMVDFKEKHHVDYTYYSDAGRRFQLIYDPINNDRIKCDDKNTLYDDLDALLMALDNRAIISTHPHRWSNSIADYVIHESMFKLIKTTAKSMAKIPWLKKLMSRYYYLAKRI